MHRAPRTAGFSLIQISILLTVASLMMVAVLPTPQAPVRMDASSTGKMNTILTALRQYQAATCSLPCPADPTLATGANNYGVAAANPGTGSPGNCTGGTPAAAYADTTKHIAIGMVPWKTLGLSYEYALDGWGRDITYAVDTGATNQSAGTAAITITDNGITRNSVAALVSHGKDGYGAWLPLAGNSGTAPRFDNGSTDTAQADNAQVAHGGGLTANTTFASFINQTQSATFDDSVVYQSNLWNINSLPKAFNATVSSYPANGTYGSGTVFTFTITSAFTITVTGTPRLALTALGTGHLGNSVSPYISYANYVSGSGTKTLTFTYTVQSGDTAPTSGIALSSSIDLNGGTATVSPCLPFTPPDLSKVLISNGYLWVADYSNNRVLKLTTSGTFVQSFGSSGNSDSKLSNPTSVITDSSGNIWVIDAGNNRIVEYNSSGQWLMTIGGAYNKACGGTYISSTSCAYLPAGVGGSPLAYTACCAPNTSSCSCGAISTKGGFNSNYASPMQIAFDKSGNLWATDYGNGRVQEFNSSTGQYIGGFSHGSCPSGIAVDNNNIVWISDDCDNVVYRCNMTGTTCTTVSGLPTIGCNQCSDYVTYDSSTGNIWVNDQGGGVYKISGAGTYLGKLSNSHTTNLDGLFFDSTGKIWVSDDAANKIYQIDPSTSNILQTVGTGTGSGTSPLQFNNPQTMFINSR
jgi:streptogramin lyase